MSDSHVVVNVPASQGKKIKTFQSVDGDGNVVETEAITLVDSDGFEIFPALESTQLDVLAAIRTQSPFPPLFSGVNGELVPLVAAMPLAQPTTTLLRAGAASGFALANAIGLVVVGAAPTLIARGIGDGPLTLPTAIWDLVTGQSGGLTPGARYYLDVTIGRISTSPPTTPGQYVTLLGNAISDVTFLVRPEPPILL
jgi:hypothetical protein